MRYARQQGSLPRSAGLIALAALAVHQLRYLLAYGSGAGQVLADQGHGYLTQLAPVLIGFVLATLAAGLLRAALRRQRPAGPLGRSLPARAALYAATIFAVFSAQELCEGALLAGHAGGLAAVLAGGGWLALPLAALTGLLAALLDGGLAALARLVAEGDRPALPRAPRRSGSLRPEVAMRLTVAAPLAFGLARRPPPAPLAG